MNKNISLMVDSDLIDQFEKVYGRKILRIFIRRAIIKAVHNKEFFNEVFFEVVHG